MNRQNGLLLASFLESYEEEYITKEVEFIVNNLKLTSDMIFLIEQKSEVPRLLLTYNAMTEQGRRFHPTLFTMRVHRKKQTNTLYTINALNLAVAEEHDGKTGRDLKLDWNKYQDSILLTAGKKLQSHPIEVLKIFKIEDAPDEN
tara:strand:- start:231 stop:665 length:435 start_codon:yes stop_codon:yes gene_type:complete